MRRYFLILIKDNFDPGLNLNLPFKQLRKNNCKNLCKTALSTSLSSLRVREPRWTSILHITAHAHKLHQPANRLGGIQTAPSWGQAN
jgi:hypothetical protein